MDVSLDPTLGCGQAHRWRKGPEGDWNGVIGDRIVSLRQTGYGFECTGDISRSDVETYFRIQDDLPAIIAEISGKDREVAAL